MIDFLVDLLEQIALGAYADAHVIELTHEGGPARYVLRNPNGCQDPACSCCFIGLMMNDGETITVNRTARLLVEPLDAVRIRALVAVRAGWSTT